MKKLLNLKNMKETIMNYSGDQKEFDKIMEEAKNICNENNFQIVAKSTN